MVYCFASLPQMQIFETRYPTSFWQLDVIQRSQKNKHEANGQLIVIVSCWRQSSREFLETFFRKPCRGRSSRQFLEILFLEAWSGSSKWLGEGEQNARHVRVPFWYVFLLFLLVVAPSDIAPWETVVSLSIRRCYLIPKEMCMFHCFPFGFPFVPCFPFSFPFFPFSDVAWDFVWRR